MNILERQGVVKQRKDLQDGEWLSRFVLVEYPTHMKTFRAKHSDDVQQAMNDPDNEYEVSQLVLLTTDYREFHEYTVSEPYPMSSDNVGKKNIITSRYISTLTTADVADILEERYDTTGFTTLSKQLVMTVMLQGDINSPGQILCIITKSLEGVSHSKPLPFQDKSQCHGKSSRPALENQQTMYDYIQDSSITPKVNETSLVFKTCECSDNIHMPSAKTSNAMIYILEPKGNSKTQWQ